MSLQRLRECVNELNSTNSSNDKMEILAKYDDCKKYFYYAFNPHYRFGVTSNTKDKNIGIIPIFNNYSDLFALLNDLKDRVITGHDAIFAVRSFIEENKEYEDLIYMILDKNIEVRMGASLINKVWKNYIPEFKVALANKYRDRKDKVDFNKELWFCSHKYDSVRVLTIIDNVGNVNCFSRLANEFATLDVLKDEIKTFDLKNIVLDGELCILDDDGKENFKEAISQIKNKNHTIKNPMYKMFDMIEYDDFIKGYSPQLFAFRLKNMIEFMKKYKPTRISTVRQIEVNSVEHLEEMFEYAFDHGWEGLIIRKNSPYEGKRSNDMLKLKKFLVEEESDKFDGEYEVVSITTKNQRVINSETGLEETIELLSRANFLYKGNLVGVGSGFTLEQRKRYKEHPELIIGKQITVCCPEESCDKNGKISVRFPTLKHVWEEGERDV